MTNTNPTTHKKTIIFINPLQSKVFCLGFAFFAIPLVTYFVMSGEFLKYKGVFLIVSALFAVFSAVLCVKNKKNIRGTFVVWFLILSAFISSFTAFNGGYLSAVGLVDDAGTQRHGFSGYIVSEGADTGKQMFIKLCEMDGRKLDKRITVHGYNYMGLNMDDGTFVEFEAKLRLAENKAYSYSTYLKGKGIHATVYSIKNMSVNADKSKFSVRSFVKGFFSDRMFEIFKAVPEKDKFERAYSISNAMMFGDKNGLDDDMKNSFTASGIIHILCVSGLHFSVMLGAVSFILKYACKKRTARKIILLAVALMYLFLCGFTRSAMRAAVMAFVSSAGVSGISKRNCTYSLMFAVSVICIFDPSAVFDGGFMMSVICCTGILCASVLLEAVSKRFAFHPVTSCIVSMFLVSLSASAFLMPYSIMSFGGVSTVSVVSSVLTVLPAEAFLILCWISSFVSLAGFDFINTVFSIIMSGISEYICSVAKFFSELEFSYIEFNIPDFSFAIFAAVLFLGALAMHSRRRAVSVYLFVVSASVLANCVLLASRL